MKRFIIIICLLGNVLVSIGQSIVQAEYFVDIDKGFRKNKLISLSSSSNGNFPFTVDLTGITPGLHQLYIRTKSSTGKWGETVKRVIEVLPINSQKVISSGEYFIDQEPGFGAAVPINVTSADSTITQTFVAALTGLATGTHKLYERFKDSYGIWGQTFYRVIEVLPNNNKQQVASAEYFFDIDPGIGGAKAVGISKKDSTVSQNFRAAVLGLDAGFHQLYIRTRDSYGNWSHTTKRDVEVVKDNDTAYVVTAEFYIGSDEGFGNCKSLTITNPFQDSSLTFNIPMQQLHNGPDTFYVRVRDSANSSWSLTQMKAVTISGLSSARNSLVETKKNHSETGDKTNVLSLTVNPNPVRSTTAIISVSNFQSKELQLNIFNSLGSKVLSQKINTARDKTERMSLNVSSLLPGIYIIRVIDGNAIASCKLIRQ